MVSKMPLMTGNLITNEDNNIAVEISFASISLKHPLRWFGAVRIIGCNYAMA